MTRRQRWIAGLAAGAALGLGWLAVSEHRRGGPAPSATRREGGAASRPATGARSASSERDRGATPAQAGPASVGAAPVPPIRRDPGAPDRILPYRPATFLRYSDAVPATDPADDARSPIVQRVFAVTAATAAQQATIGAAWRSHEDGRRALLAAAPPPSIGPPVLDPEALGELDRAFDDVVAATLDPEQQRRLALERPPADEPSPEE